MWWFQRLRQSWSLLQPSLLSVSWPEGKIRTKVSPSAKKNNSFPITSVFLLIATDGVIFNQVQSGGMTLKRGDMRDELNYIPPPNRKLPPVPGSQYNTCDRIKRGKTCYLLFISSINFLPWVSDARSRSFCSSTEFQKHYLYSFEDYHTHHDSHSLDPNCFNLTFTIPSKTWNQSHRLIYKTLLRACYPHAIYFLFHSKSVVFIICFTELLDRRVPNCWT